MNIQEQEIYEYAKRIAESKSDYFDSNHRYQYKHTERCIEVPLFASYINKFNIKSLLDIGFTFASLDYLRMILDFARNNKLSGLDIIEPKRIMSRYPKEWHEEITKIKVNILDISKDYLKDETYDAVSIISTLEHVGFDEKNKDESSKSSFNRPDDVTKVKKERSKTIEEDVLNNIYKMLKPSGYCIISVPAGRGGVTLLKDSLGLYTCEWEYEENSWVKIVNNPNFRCVEQRFFKDTGSAWVEKKTIKDLKDVTAEMKPCASGVAICVLQKKINVLEN